MAPHYEIDERFFKEWLAAGFRAMATYLERWAEFDAWEQDQQSKEHPE